MSLEKVKQKLKSNKRKVIAIGILGTLAIAFPSYQPIITAVANVLGLVETVSE